MASLFSFIHFFCDMLKSVEKIACPIEKFVEKCCLILT